ncbi:hypothetical protein E2C01_029279 [Portunus trituberculatus]|uniref:Uncharacterized protein n=1 Tax=Portunus trituberculatus TaxID=210409 RepID=A0A5B7ENV2_PORTR|nr:hypothetical protein [Portunus trituberculatus]
MYEKCVDHRLRCVERGKGPGSGASPGRDVDGQESNDEDAASKQGVGRWPSNFGRPFCEKNDSHRHQQSVAAPYVLQHVCLPALCTPRYAIHPTPAFRRPPLCPPACPPPRATCHCLRCRAPAPSTCRTYALNECQTCVCIRA